MQDINSFSSPFLYDTGIAYRFATEAIEALMRQERELLELYDKKDALLQLVNYEWSFKNNKEEYARRLQGDVEL